MKVISNHLAFAFLALSLVACSVLKNDDPEKEARKFLQEFQADLSKPDDELLTKFNVSQSRDAIIMALRVLQNADPFIVCDARITDATLTIEKEHVKVEIPTRFSVKELDSQDTAAYTLVLWLSRGERDGYVISIFDGEPFYQAFLQIKNRNQWEAGQETALEDRFPIYEKARELEKTFDSVIWYVPYMNANYFYVVRGTWRNDFLNTITPKRDTTARMGLVDGDGNIIIPIEYSLVGAINFLPNYLVEVTKAGKVGYFDFARRKLVVPAVYDIIIPYNTQYVVKNGSAYGWLDDRFIYHEGFSSVAAENWVKNFEFLKQPVLIAPIRQAFCEIPSEDYAGNGILPMPSYLSKYGVFKEIESDISTTDVPLHGWSEYRELTGTALEKISDRFTALITGFRERYLEGREEFYDESKVVLLNNQQDTLSISRYGISSIVLHRIDSNLLEVRGQPSYSMDDSFLEMNLPAYHYLSLSGNTVTRLPSDRQFPQTQHVRLDSSYLMGEFHVWNNDTHAEQTTSFLSEKTITYMRDELLASNGYRFPEVERVQEFVYHPWYTPKYTDLVECEAQMSAIDRYNLAFLNRVLERMKPASV